MKAQRIKILRECACLLPVLLFSTLSLTAQQPQRILLRAGQVIDVHTGNEAADQTIIVTGDKITAIAATASTPAQTGDKEIDLRGLTVLPGMIDAHTHLTSNPDFDPYVELTTTPMKEALMA
jgi:imidazolonepropionase-like amidohydrolase